MDGGEVAAHISVDYNTDFHRVGKMTSPPAVPCMRKEYYPPKDHVVMSLRSGTADTSTQRRRAVLDQAPKKLAPHVLSLRSQLILLVAVSFTLASCAPSAQLVNETATGGTVLYSYIEEQDVLTSPERQDALLLLEEKCPAGYRIARQGEVPNVGQAVDRAWMGQLSRDGQVSREKRWAIQFACK